jgi:replication initiation protein RepC
MDVCSPTTTPFGRRPLKLAHIAAQAMARERPPEATVHKWRVFRALCAARARLSLSERALAVLDALLSFHPETALSGDNLVVFPSNAQLCLRAHGMAPATLRRHLAALVDAGIVIRRDSPNGKRYARRDRDGEIERAFGFDLSPLAARAGEFEALAEEARTAERALRCARERITLARRDVAKMIAAAVAENVAPPCDGALPATWPEVHALYRRLVEAIPRKASLGECEEIAADLAKLAARVANVLETHVKAQDLSANESQSERHIQNSNTEPPVELEPEREAAAEAPPAARKQPTFALPLVLQACPDIADYARGGIGDWRDLCAAADIVRRALGVSPSAWAAARAAMGEAPAAIAVAAILQRGAAIASPGGYLRDLTAKAQAGAFSVGPMLMALVSARNRDKKRA